MNVLYCRLRLQLQLRATCTPTDTLPQAVVEINKLRNIITLNLTGISIALSVWYHFI
jgi:hypothetical protein